MAKVTCQVCKNKLEKQDAFKVQKGNKANNYKYYCNEQEYLKSQINTKKVTCQICKKQLPILDAHKVSSPVGSKVVNKYYCSQEEYTKNKIENEKYHDVMLYFATDILEYEKGQILPSNLKKRIKKLNSFYEYEVIKLTLKMNRDYLNNIVRTKSFDSENNMVSYLMVVIENHINDAYRKWNADRLQQKKVVQAETDMFVVNGLDTVINKPVNESPSNGIGSFLDDGDF